MTAGPLADDEAFSGAPLPTSAPPGSGLMALRMVFFAMAAALVPMGVVVGLSTGGSDADRPIDLPVGLGFVAAVGIGALVVSSLLAGTLLCGSPAELAASYRNRFFRQIAFAEAPALLGVVVSFVVGSPLPYLIGALVALVGFVRMAPTDARLQRDQDALVLQGCGHSLTAALAAPLPASGRPTPPT